MIIDAHIHRYPLEVSEDPAAFAEARGENHWLRLVAPENHPSLQGWADRKKMIDDMDAAKVDKAVLLGWYWENPETCALHNQWHSEWIAKDPDRFIAFAAAHPLTKGTCMDDLKSARDKGFRGIGEIHPGAQGFSMRDPRWLAIVEFAIEEDWPMNFHVTEPAGRIHSGRIPTPFEDFQWLAANYPELKIILAHWGGLLPFYEMNEHVRKTFSNVWYDVAASPLLYGSQVFRSVVDAVGADKILFGSDYPLLLYPSRSKEPDFVTFLEEINNSGLNEIERHKILGDNFAQLLGLSE
jgi:uncharacterized protein